MSAQLYPTDPTDPLKRPLWRRFEGPDREELARMVIRQLKRERDLRDDLDDYLDGEGNGYD